MPFASLLRVGILAVLVHNLEEALAMPAWLDGGLRVLALRFGLTLRVLPSHEAVYASLVLAALVPGLVLWFGSRRPAGSPGLLAGVFVAALFFVNAFWHIGVALLLGTYAPGVATAALVTLPYGALALRRALREAQASAVAVGACLLAGLLLHAAGAALLLASAGG